MTLEVDMQGGGIVSDWIDRLKNKNQPWQSEKARQEELRLHKAKVIHAKLPTFWAALEVRVKADCDKLRETFPNDKNWNCDVTVLSPHGFTINGGGLPRRILELELNLDGLCIDTVEGEKQEFMQAYLSNKIIGQIPIEVGESEELRLRFKGMPHVFVESLSEHLVSYVARIKN